MEKNKLFKQNEESFDMNIIEMPEQLDELSMSSVKGGGTPVKPCCTNNGGAACNIYSK